VKGPLDRLGLLSGALCRGDRYPGRSLAICYEGVAGGRRVGLGGARPTNQPPGCSSAPSTPMLKRNPGLAAGYGPVPRTPTLNTDEMGAKNCGASPLCVTVAGAVASWPPSVVHPAVRAGALRPRAYAAIGIGSKVFAFAG